MNREVLRAEGIVKRRSGAVVLNHADLNIFEAESVALLGRNSSGKSTLAAILSGESQEDGGRILIDDKASTQKQRRERIGLVRENSTLMDGLTLSENLFAIKRNAPNEIFYRKNIMEKLSQELLQSFDVKWQVRRPVSEMPASVQHVCRILKALINGRKLIVLDEICENYTQREKDFLISVIQKLNERGIAVLYISNHVDDIAKAMKRTVIIREGYCVKCLWGQAGDSSVITDLMLGYKFENAVRQRSERKAGKPLSLSGLGEQTAVSGKVLGIADLDGTMDEYFKNMLPKWQQEVKGSLALFDRESPDGEWIDEMSILDNMLLPILKRVGGPLGIVSGAMIKVFQKECTDKFPWLSSMESAGPRALTQEKRLRLLFYRWELQAPSLVIMNRLSSGIDDISKQVIYDGVESLLKTGAAVLFFSGDFNEILKVCDRTLLIFKSEVVAEFDCADKNAAERYRMIFEENR